MIITKLDIRDFGVFQGENLEDLGKGIIVIGGANRSGKTSFMQIIRNIPFGFTQSGMLPPPKFQYDVRCDLLLEDGNSANVLLKGFSNPEVVYHSALHYDTSRGLYNIDKGTYRELFTISLDELNKSDGKEDSNLQSMLLGAGFKNIVKIPFIAKGLREKASSIGGTRGNPSIKMFKPFALNIKQEVEGRRKSLLQLGSFTKKKNNLAMILDTINLKQVELQNSNNDLIKLDVLRHYYDINQNKINLEAELETYFFSSKNEKEYNIEKAKTLKTQYTKELEQCNNDNDMFQRANTQKLMKELLLGNRVLIASFYNGISGIKERCKNIIIIKDEYYEKTGLLKKKIKKANDNWVNFNDVSSINCDEVQQGILAKNIESFKKIELSRVDCDKKTQDFKNQRDILEKQMLPYKSTDYMKKYFYFVIVFMIIGIVLSFVDKLIGCSLIILGSIGAGLYLSINYSTSKLMINRNEDNKAQIDKIKAESNNNSQQIKNLDENIRELDNIMDEYRDILMLDARVNVEGIKDYFKTAAYLKDEITEYNLLEIKLMNQFNSINESLNKIDNLLNKFTGFNTKDLEKITLDNMGDVCKDKILKVEVLYKLMLLGEKAEMSLSKLLIVEKEIFDFLGVNSSNEIILSLEKYINQGEKYIEYVNKQNELKVINEKLLQGVKGQQIKRILYDIEDEDSRDEDEKLLKILGALFKLYVNISQLNLEFESSEGKNKELIVQLDILKNEKQTLKDELQSLNSDEMLVKHAKGIMEARAELRPLAEKYAVYNTAALFLEKIRERFLINAKDNLLKDASDILSEITSGEYKDIMPMDDLMQGDFKTKLLDESIKDSSKELSRGTKEQLFLAVRISRIKEIKPSLPVIFDDSFVNFDIAHTKNTVKAIVELSKTHQIFVLTCHPTLVDLIVSQTSDALYYKLNKGKFTKSLGEDLSEYLREL